MLATAINPQLLWISPRQAINPVNIVSVFRGTHGELEITFMGGRNLQLHEHELSAEGRALLLPSDDQARILESTMSKH